MKAFLLAGALAVVAYGSTARAADEKCKCPPKKHHTAMIDKSQGSSVGSSSNRASLDERGIGGSEWKAPGTFRAEGEIPAPPVTEPLPPFDSSGKTGVSSEQSSMNPEAMPSKAEHRSIRERTEKKVGPLEVMAGGGVEGFMGSASSLVAPGVAWGVSAVAQPSQVVGLELGYSGAANNLYTATSTIGPDIVRNGLSGIATVGLPLSLARLKPYVLGGIGVNRYSVRGGQEAGFKSDTSGTIPLGGGLRTHLGAFTADARFDYNLGLGEQFAPVTTGNLGRYQGLLQLGANF